MGIPEQCSGCEVVASIQSEPINGFTERIKELTGKDVHSYGGQYNRGRNYPPDYVHLVPEGMASEGQISQAWYGARHAVEDRDDKVAEQVTDCPGLCEANVSIPGVEEGSVVRVCGKTALAALGQEQ